MQRKINTIKKNIKIILKAGKETGLEVNMGETKYMNMTQNQNWQQRHCTTINLGSW
jgi:hypothetical protein